MNCTVDKCENEALYAFTWPWGTPGFCCAKHMAVVTQRGQQTRGRFGGVAFSPLNPDRPREITRDERIELHAGRLTAESERDDAKLRAAKLFEANTQLANDVRVHRARCMQLEAEVKQLLSRIEGLIEERDAALIASEKAREAAEHLGVKEFAPFTPDPHLPSPLTPR